jgi:hypothetical protein
MHSLAFQPPRFGASRVLIWRLYVLRVAELLNKLRERKELRWTRRYSKRGTSFANCA